MQHVPSARFTGPNAFAKLAEHIAKADREEARRLSATRQHVAPNANTRSR